MDIDHASQAAHSAQSHTLINCAQIADALGPFLNSSFSTALCGAFAGAVGAHYFARASKTNDDLLAAFRDNNSAIALAFSVWNTAVTFKRQHVKPLYDVYRSQQIQRLMHALHQRARTFPRGTYFNLSLYFVNLSLPFMPIDALQEKVHHKLNPGNRAVMLTATLMQTLEELRRSLNARNAFIGYFRSVDQGDEDLRAALYLGLPYSDGHRDTTYPGTVQSIYHLNDDVIFFSQLLCRDLQGNGRNLLAQLERWGGRPSLRITAPDFQSEKVSNLLPNDRHYQDWLHNFPTGYDANRVRAIDATTACAAIA